MGMASIRALSLGVMGGLVLLWCSIGWASGQDAGDESDSGSGGDNAGTPARTMDRLEEMLAVGEPAFTQADVDGWVEEVLALTERLAGREFDEAPSVRVVSRADLAASVRADLNAQLGLSELDDADEEVRALEEQVDLVADRQSMLVLGRLSPTSDALLLVAENYEPLMRVRGIEGLAAGDVMRLVIAHELARGLQQQEIERAGGELVVASAEQQRTFSAVAAGQVTFVHQMVAETLGIRPEISNLVMFISAAMIEFLDRDAPELVAANRVFAEQMLGGTSFVRWSYEQAGGGEAGRERIWALLMSPPESLEAMRVPFEAMSSREERDSALIRGVFEGVGASLPGAGWETRAFPLGFEQIAAGFGSLTPATRSELAGSIRGAVAMTARRAEPPTGLAVRVFFLDRSEGSGERLLRALLTQMEIGLRDMALAEVAIVESREDFREGPVEADFAMRTRLVLSQDGGGEQRNEFIRVGRDRIAIELNQIGEPLDEAALESLLEMVFERASRTLAEREAALEAIQDAGAPAPEPDGSTDGAG